MDIFYEIIMFTDTFTAVYDICSLLFMQNFLKVLFKMTGILPHTLGGGLETWASIVQIFQRNTPNMVFLEIHVFHTSCNIY